MKTKDQPAGGKDAEDIVVQMENKETAQNVEVFSPGLAQAACAERMDSNESDDSEYTDNETGTDSEDDDMDNYDFDPLEFYGGDEEGLESALLRCVHPLLRHDIQMFRDLLEPSQEMKSRMSDKTAFPMVVVRNLDWLQELDCEIHMSTNNLNLPRQLARAWQLDLNEPLVLRITLSSQSYLDFPDVPKVEVFQPNKEEFPVEKQVKKMVSRFLHGIWEKFDNDLWNNLNKSESVPSCLSSTTDEETTDKNEPSVECCPDPQRVPTTDKNEPSVECCPDIQRVPNLSKLSLSCAMKTCTTEKSEAVAQSMSTSHTDPNMSKGSGNPVEMEMTTCLEAKRIPSLEHGFFVMLYKYVCENILTVNEFCVICDKPHPFQTGGAMLMPSVCSRELCLFISQTQRLKDTVTITDIATDAEVVDLLITMAKAACFSGREANTFNPFPNIQNLQLKLALCNKAEGFNLVEKLVKMIPPMEMLAISSASSLRMTLDKRDKLLYPLISWIIKYFCQFQLLTTFKIICTSSLLPELLLAVRARIIYSNRSHIVKLTVDKHLKMMSTPHQFLLLSSPPAQERAFQKAKAKYGSSFAFHGSGIENWHSIIRKGLIAPVDNKHQVDAAADESRIYLCPLASYSSKFCKTNFGVLRVSKEELLLEFAECETDDQVDWDYEEELKKSEVFTRLQFLGGENISCLALCEVIESPALEKRGDIWLCFNKNHVCTRFLFVYEDGQVNEEKVDVRDKEHSKMIEDVLAKSFKALKEKNQYSFTTS